LLTPAIAAGEVLNATVVNMRFVKPLDTALIEKIAKEYAHIVTVEENTILGGAGSAVNEYLVSKNYAGSILNLGLPDQFLDHGVPSVMLAECGLDSTGIVASIKKYLSTAHSKPDVLKSHTANALSDN
jgi:1-deoxy-D-xylulose-5-phosphate synthase